MIVEKKVVGVTGASGYIASWVIKKLLDHGHTVHATVRDTSNYKKIEHLLRFGRSHPNQLKLFEADLLEGGFESAFEGCDSIIHMASPFKVGKVKNPKRELLEPAVTGTERVLSAVNATSTITQVILTSSVVALFNDGKEAEKLPNRTFTSKHWNTRSSLNNQPYNYSKTEAEKRAWEMQRAQKRWTLSTIHPGFVMGPALSKRKDATSTDFMIQMLRGDFKNGAPNFRFPIVDVRDVAECHIHALEREHEPDRFIAVREVKTMLDMARIAQRVTEKIEYPLPTTTLPDFALYVIGPIRGFSWKYLRNNLNAEFQFDTTSTIEKIGVLFRPIEDTLRDMILQLERDDLIN